MFILVLCKNWIFLLEWYKICRIIIERNIYTSKEGRYTMKREHQNHVVPKQIKEILNFKSKISKKAGREVSFSEALACWLAYGYGDQFIEKNFYH